MQRNSQSNIKKSNIAIFKAYMGQLAIVRGDLKSSVKSLESKKANLPTYYRYKYHYEYADALSDAEIVYKRATTTQKWFSSKTKVGGRFPVGHWRATEPLGYIK